MPIETKNFESHFGFSVPQNIVDFYVDCESSGILPATFRFKHVGFILELQYLLDVANPENYNVEDGRFRFAVTSDGFDLLVDLNSEKLEILQDEYGDIDSLGISIKDLIEAEKQSQ